VGRQLILQLDVRKGQQPRSVRTLLAHGTIEVRQGRYVRPSERFIPERIL
jgi:hypothetical protein